MLVLRGPEIQLYYGTVFVSYHFTLFRVFVPFCLDLKSSRIMLVNQVGQCLFVSDYLSPFVAHSIGQRESAYRYRQCSCCFRLPVCSCSTPRHQIPFQSGCFLLAKLSRRSLFFHRRCRLWFRSHSWSPCLVSPVPLSSPPHLGTSATTAYLGALIICANLSTTRVKSCPAHLIRQFPDNICSMDLAVFLLPFCMRGGTTPLKCLFIAIYG
jgi:hypothetical protein